MESKDKDQTIGIIYVAFCTINGKRYIGQTCNSLEQRIAEHLRAAKRQKLEGIFQRAIKKHGHENFKWGILRKCSSKIELNHSEITLIAAFNTTDRNFGYNMTPGGTGGRIVENLPNKDEIYRKRAEKIKGENNGFYGKTHTKETRRKISEAHKGRVKPLEAREKMRTLMKDRYFSPEHRNRISEAKKGKGNAMFGKTLSEEHKNKIRQGVKNAWASKNRKA